jgi:hypothetical protein
VGSVEKRASYHIVGCPQSQMGPSNIKSKQDRVTDDFSREGGQGLCFIKVLLEAV